MVKVSAGGVRYVCSKYPISKLELCVSKNTYYNEQTSEITDKEHITFFVTGFPGEGVVTMSTISRDLVKTLKLNKHDIWVLPGNLEWKDNKGRPAVRRTLIDKER